jgi:hypothetical protein
MPFDGTDFRPAVAVIDKVIDLLGPNGERWIKSSTSSPDGRCIIGALRRSRLELKVKGDKAATYIRHAIAVLEPPAHPWREPSTIPFFNDIPHRKFGDVAMVLAYARAMAAGEKPEVSRVGRNALYIDLEP